MLSLPGVLRHFTHSPQILGSSRHSSLSCDAGDMISVLENMLTENVSRLIPDTSCLR